MTLAIKFTGVGGTARFGHGSLCPPGESMPSTGIAELCVRGYHAARRSSIARWFGPEAYLVRLGGPADDSPDKLCRAECHVVARLVWSAADSADYALACARHAADAARYAARYTASHAAYAAASADAAADAAAYAAADAARAAADAASYAAADAARASAYAALDAASSYAAAYAAAAVAERAWQSRWILRRLRHNNPLLRGVRLA